MLMKKFPWQPDTEVKMQNKKIKDVFSSNYGYCLKTLLKLSISKLQLEYVLISLFLVFKKDTDDPD